MNHLIQMHHAMPGSGRVGPGPGRMGPGDFAPGDMMTRFYPGYGMLHLIIWLAILAAVVVLIVWIVRRTGQRYAAPMPPPTQRQPDAAMNEVRMRYARGEIDQGEFMRISQDLSGGPAS